jgi:hypothetical protein
MIVIMVQPVGQQNRYFFAIRSVLTLVFHRLVPHYLSFFALEILLIQFFCATGGMPRSLVSSFILFLE